MCSHFLWWSRHIIRVFNVLSKIQAGFFVFSPGGELEELEYKWHVRFSKCTWNINFKEVKKKKFFTIRSMRQKRTHVQQSPGLKSRVRTSFRRSNFVSYSGKGSPKTKVRRNENTPRIPYSYTNKQKWNTFFTNGRPHFHKNCLLLCDVIFEADCCRFWEESHSHLPGEHAEVKALRRISTKEQQADTFAR